MSKKPAELMMEIATQLDPQVPGYQFRYDALCACANLVDAWDREMQRISAMQDPVAQRDWFQVSCLAVAKSVSSALTGCMLYQNEQQGAADLRSIIAIMVSEMEDYSGYFILPSRDVVDKLRFMSSKSNPDGALH